MLIKEKFGPGCSYKENCVTPINQYSSWHWTKQSSVWTSCEQFSAYKAEVTQNLLSVLDRNENWLVTAFRGAL